jgi:hypothetical protein
MPKIEIDYSNTIIYKITCKDKQVTDVYVGHTTNFVQRKHAHKQSCLNSKCKLYEVIRAHGGWSNWSMEIINFFHCNDHYEARKKEQEYFILLNATLNSIEPFPKPKPKIVKQPLAKNHFVCNTCNIYCTSHALLEQHNKSKKHNKSKQHLKIVAHNGEDNTTKPVTKYECLLCDISCSKKNDWDRHLLTRKHLKHINGPLEETNIPQKDFTCKCGKKYVNNSGLWKHAKVCKNDNIENEIITHNIIDSTSNEIKLLTNLVLEMVKSNGELQKQNNELQKKVLDVCTSNMTINNHTNNNNSNNKTFNLQFFLNEQCKDAMNLSDFMNSFELGLEDLESIGELGYVEGITKIMVDRLNAMDIYKRPVHCSDAKRETLYVKNDDRWEKEARNNPKLRYAIKTASFQSMKLTVLWSETYPESKSSESRLNDKYMKLVFNSTGGHGEIADSEDKIIRRILKEIVIDKK